MFPSVPLLVTSVWAVGGCSPSAPQSYPQCSRRFMFGLPPPISAANVAVKHIVYRCRDGAHSMLSTTEANRSSVRSLQHTEEALIYSVGPG
ncbi:hypothetical protein B0T21DRAFT_373678 [Apiosordaria backusii]|uniref:Secreted protein n=1 Tax=Apiosordaria backusii TaxID=314023 RepID=A0AA40AT25_9PEZI|nr:hypothetical protein B0T21DRAFT_373678 [Apiosordaria backusii]